MTYEVVMPYHLHMPSYFLGTFTEYPYQNDDARDILQLFHPDSIIVFLGWHSCAI